MLSPANILVMFEELATGKVRHEHAVALAKKDLGGTVRPITQVLSDLGRNKHPTTNEACRVMEVALELYGMTNCLTRVFPSASQVAFTTFIVDKLRHDRSKFNDEDLARLEVPTSSNDILSGVRLARIAHIEEEGQQLLANPTELTNDLKEIQGLVSSYSFPPALNALLDKVQAEFCKGDSFDQAAMMGHLRTFFEKLHQHVSMTLQVKKPDSKDATDLTKCQQVIDYLARKDVLSTKTQALGRALYGILSEKGVHALESTREYVRLCRNMVAEYGLILFYELDRRLKE